jgi:hypothetical protein
MPPLAASLRCIRVKEADVADISEPNHVGAAYDQLCISYRAIDEFRAKLLGFLPLVTGGGLVLLTGRSTKYAGSSSRR